MLGQALTKNTYAHTSAGGFITEFEDDISDLTQRDQMDDRFDDISDLESPESDNGCSSKKLHWLLRNDDVNRYLLFGQMCNSDAKSEIPVSIDSENAPYPIRMLSSGSLMSSAIMETTGSQVFDNDLQSTNIPVKYDFSRNNFYLLPQSVREELAQQQYNTAKSMDNVSFINQMRMYNDYGSWSSDWEPPRMNMENYLYSDMAMPISSENGLRDRNFSTSPILSYLTTSQPSESFPAAVPWVNDMYSNETIMAAKTQELVATVNAALDVLESLDTSSSNSARSLSPTNGHYFYDLYYAPQNCNSHVSEYPNRQVGPRHVALKEQA